MTTTLKVAERTGKITDAELIPAVVYGPKQKSISLSLNKKDFTKMYAVCGNSTVINLEGLDETIEVLVHDISFLASSQGIGHVDFYAIERGKELEVSVPLEFTGEFEAGEEGAVINKVLHEVNIVCKPRDLISEITVDISHLKNIDDAIRIKDLIVPKTLKIENDPEDVVVVISKSKEEEPEESGEAAAQTLPPEAEPEA